MTKRRIYLHGMKFIDTKPNINQKKTHNLKIIIKNLQKIEKLN